MDKAKQKEILVAFASIMTVALEAEEEGLGPFSQTSAYMALGSNIDKWLLVKRIMLSSQMMKPSAEIITLTEKGKEMARKLKNIVSRKEEIKG